MKFTVFLAKLQFMFQIFKHEDEEMCSRTAQKKRLPKHRKRQPLPRFGQAHVRF